MHALDDDVARAVRGDEAAFRRLWTALQRGLVRYLTVMGGIDMADDLASETGLQVVRDLHRFRGDGEAFRRWVFTVARHRAVDAGRRRQRGDPSPPPPEHHRSAEDEALDRISLNEALGSVASLPSKQAEVVALRLIAGLDTGATARVLATSPAAVRVNLHRGLRARSELPIPWVA